MGFLLGLLLGILFATPSVHHEPERKPCPAQKPDEVGEFKEFRSLVDGHVLFEYAVATHTEYINCVK